MANSSRKTQFIKGLLAAIPLILGFIPIAIAYAIMARQSGLTLIETCGMSLLVFAGASQMMSVGMYSQGAGLVTIIIATFILNLRHLIMSTCVMNRMTDGSLGLRLLASFGVTDESFAVFTTGKEENCNIMFFLGLALGTYIAWNLGTLAGAVASNLMPDTVSASLGIALYAMFITLLLPSLTKNRGLALLALLTAVCNSIFCTFMASSWALIASTLICAFAGVFFVELDDEKKESMKDEQH